MVFCQLVHPRRCILGQCASGVLKRNYRRHLTRYELVNEQNWECARHLFECLAQLGTHLASKSSPSFSLLPTQDQFLEDRSAKDPRQVVLTTCSSLVSTVKEGDAQPSHQIFTFLCQGVFDVGTPNQSKGHRFLFSYLLYLFAPSSNVAWLGAQHPSASLKTDSMLIMKCITDSVHESFQPTLNWEYSGRTSSTLI